jgi:hypothetical protein
VRLPTLGRGEAALGQRTTRAQLSPAEIAATGPTEDNLVSEPPSVGRDAASPILSGALMGCALEQVTGLGGQYVCWLDMTSSTSTRDIFAEVLRYGPFGAIGHCAPPFALGGHHYQADQTSRRPRSAHRVRRTGKLPQDVLPSLWTSSSMPAK